MRRIREGSAWGLPFLSGTRANPDNYIRLRMESQVGIWYPLPILIRMKEIGKDEVE